MNAGAYGAELAQYVSGAVCIAFDPARGYFLKDYLPEDMRLGYRKSVFQENGEIIVSASFRLEKGDRTASFAKIDELNKKRRDSQPLTLPSAGSAFKRPASGYAAELIEKAGLKGYKVGGAAVSAKHAGFIVNEGNACAGDVEELMRVIIERVYEFSGVTLEPEIKVIGG